MKESGIKKRLKREYDAKTTQATNDGAQTQTTEDGAKCFGKSVAKRALGVVSVSTGDVAIPTNRVVCG